MATKKKVDVAQTSMTAAQLAGHIEGLARRVKDGSFGQRHFEALANGHDPFAPDKSENANTNDQVERWRHHFRTFYGMSPDFSDLYIPDRKAGFDRLIIVPKGLVERKWLKAALRIHGVYASYGGNVESDRNSTLRSYGIWIRDHQEPDAEDYGVSPYDFTRLLPGISGITLLERLVAGTGYLFEKMCHMDMLTYTVCLGSRYSDGGVPNILWDSQRCAIKIGYFHSSDTLPGYSTRVVVY